MAKLGGRAHDAILAPGSLFPCYPDDEWPAVLSRVDDAREKDAGVKLLAIRRRYQARMVSGWATGATSLSALRPSRLAISARVTRSGSESRSRIDRWQRRIRF